jgi:hypothetical protein
VLVSVPFGRRRLIHVLPGLALVVLSSLACTRANTQSTGRSGPRDPVDGLWMHREMPVRYSEAMTLTVHGYAVRGTGTYMMEAGREGTTTITGSKRRGVLTLHIVRDSGVRERWTGRLTRGRLRGELVFEDTPRDHQRFDFERPGAVPRRP